MVFVRSSSGQDLLPASPQVSVTMTAEAEPVPPVTYEILACEPPQTLAVSATDDYGQWRLTAELSETDGRTTLTLRQEDVDLDTLPQTGPGWEWYLDRLVAAASGGTPPTLGDFDTTYLPMGTAYTAMTD